MFMKRLRIKSLWESLGQLRLYGTAPCGWGMSVWSGVVWPDLVRCVEANALEAT